MGVANPFFTLLSPSYQGAFYARPNLRLGAVRGEASFGEPISFGMFLGLALVLGVHLALTARSRLQQVVYLALSGLLVVGLTTTQSRGALLVAAVGLLGYFLAQARRVSVLRIGALVGAALVVVLSTSVLSSVQRLVQSSSGQTREAASAEYRLQILEVVKDPEQFSLLGKVTEATGTQASTDLTRRVGLKSIDSQYALVYLDGGVLCFVVFASVAGLVVATALRPTLRPAERAWAMGLAATFANLLTVALFTQEADLVWIGVAVLAGATQRAREGRAP
jgi:O-antigen ligase